jgi:hypothetical protein
MIAYEKFVNAYCLLTPFPKTSQHNGVTIHMLKFLPNQSPHKLHILSTQHRGVRMLFFPYGFKTRKTAVRGAWREELPKV